jgi:RNA polymerase sigma-70 factor (ECF subfamily)
MDDHSNPGSIKAGDIDPENTDLEYLEKIHLGDTNAFSVLFRKYYEPLYQFAGRLVKDTQIAENIVQDVFVKMWINRENWHIKTSVKSYLYTAVKNHSLNYLKREKRTISTGVDSNYQDNFAVSPEEEFVEKEMLDAIHKAINKLPQQCRQIYLMKRYDYLKYTEIAEILNISINTVKTQMKRALKSLLKNLAYLMPCLF